jgi:biopolymer transport protein ExbB/TolQ
VGAEKINYAEKSKILAGGIAEAMNCTAFGLLTAIIAVIGFVIISTWVQIVEDGIHAETVKIYNVALRRAVR